MKYEEKPVSAFLVPLNLLVVEQHEEYSKNPVPY